MEIAGYFLALLVGISLGLIGGGGAILTVPILVYLFHINPPLATSYSLFIVGTAALMGTYKHYKLGNLQLNIALQFGIPAVTSLIIIRKFVLPNLPNTIIKINHFTVTKNIFFMIVFAILMIAAATAMIKKTPIKLPQKTNNKKIVAIGFMVGLITGFLGAGGGFLIIPALVFFANLPMKKAVGTSLFIICINALIGFTTDVLNGIQLNYQLLLLFTTIAVVGIFIGTFLSTKIDSNKLKPAFGWFVLVMGMYIITKEIIAL
jgi:uncharacterized protein